MVRLGSLTSPASGAVQLLGLVLLVDEPEAVDMPLHKIFSARNARSNDLENLLEYNQDWIL